MILLIHIVAALASVAYTTYLFFAPSRSKLKISYGLVAATLTTGTFLVVSNPAHMLQSCITGITYVGVMTVGIAAVQYRLARQEQ